MNTSNTPPPSQTLRRRQLAATRHVVFARRTKSRQLVAAGKSSPSFSQQHLQLRPGPPSSSARAARGSPANKQPSGPAAAAAAASGNGSTAGTRHQRRTAVMSSTTAAADASGPVPAGAGHFDIPWYQTELPLLSDPLQTETSILQDSTAEDCLTLLRGDDDDEPSLAPIAWGDAAHTSLSSTSASFAGGQNDGGWRSGRNAKGLPPLDRSAHVRFLRRTLEQMPSQWVSIDPSRPWVLYWAFCGLSTLGKQEEIALEYRDR